MRILSDTVQPLSTELASHAAAHFESRKWQQS